MGNVVIGGLAAIIDFDQFLMRARGMLSYQGVIAKLLNIYTSHKVIQRDSHSIWGYRSISKSIKDKN